MSPSVPSPSVNRTRRKRLARAWAQRSGQGYQQALAQVRGLADQGLLPEPLDACQEAALLILDNTAVRHPYRSSADCPALPAPAVLVKNAQAALSLRWLTPAEVSSEALSVAEPWLVLRDGRWHRLVCDPTLIGYPGRAGQDEEWAWVLLSTVPYAESARDASPWRIDCTARVIAARGVQEVTPRR